MMPMHEKSFDFSQCRVGFGDVGLAFIHPIQQIERTRGRSSHRAGLDGGRRPPQQRRELLDERQDQRPSALDDGRRPPSNGRDVDDVARAFLHGPTDLRVALRLLRLDQDGMTMAGLGHIRRMAYGAGGIQVLRRRTSTSSHPP